jgi:hypothetical protein
MTIYSVYDQVADLMSTLDASKIANLRASKEMQDRLTYLIEKSRKSPLDKKEKDELDHYLVLERLVRLTKVRSEIRNKK